MLSALTLKWHVQRTFKNKKPFFETMEVHVLAKKCMNTNQNAKVYLSSVNSKRNSFYYFYYYKFYA